MKHLGAIALVALLLAAAPVAAQANETVEGVKDAGRDAGVDGVLDRISTTVDGAGDAIGEASEGAAEGASAVGRAVTATIQAIGAAAGATAAAVAAGSALLATGVAAGIVALGGALGGLGAGITRGIAAVATGAAEGAAWLVAGIANGLGAYVGIVEGMRPEKMPVMAFAAVTSAGAAGSAGAGGWAGWQALRRWGVMGGGLAGVAGFSRIDNDALLEHPLRAQIFETIKGHPGIHASQLAREMDVGWGTITHHLDKLQRAKMVTTRKVNNQKCFFEQGGNVSRQDMAIASALKGDTASSIAAFVQHHPMTSQKGMAEALEISPALASFHVKKLTNLGVLEKVRHGKETLLTTTEGLRRILESADPQMAALFQKQDAGFEYSS